MNSTTHLKPCPFCGGKAAFVPRAVNIALQKDPSDPKFGVSVICGQCSAESPNVIDEATAAQRWNRRATSGAAEPRPCTYPNCTCKVNWDTWEGCEAGAKEPPSASAIGGVPPSDGGQAK